MTNDEIIAALGTDYRFTSARNGNLKGMYAEESERIRRALASL